MAHLFRLRRGSRADLASWEGSGELGAAILGASAPSTAPNSATTSPSATVVRPAPQPPSRIRESGRVKSSTIGRTAPSYLPLAYVTNPPAKNAAARSRNAMASGHQRGITICKAVAAATEIRAAIQGP